MQAQLAHQITPVRLYSGGAQSQALGDVLVTDPGCDQRQNLSLTLRKLSHEIYRAVLALLALLDACLAIVAPAFQDHVDRHQQILGRATDRFHASVKTGPRYAIQQIGATAPTDGQ